MAILQTNSPVLEMRVQAVLFSLLSTALADKGTLSSRA
jgi:hypothetical protein